MKDLDWDEWICENFRIACEGIKECDPAVCPGNWESFWEVIETYKRYKESTKSYEEFRTTDGKI